MNAPVAKLKWQCRRGMRELDDLLLRFMESHYSAATPAQKSAFAALLELPDPQLAGYLLNREQPENGDLADIVRRIRGDYPP